MPHNDRSASEPSADPLPSSFMPPLPGESTESYLARTDQILINGVGYQRRMLCWCHRHPATEIARRVGWSMDGGGGIHRWGADPIRRER